MAEEDARVTEAEFLQSVFDTDCSLEDASLLEEVNLSVLPSSELRLTLRIPSDDIVPEAFLRCALPPGYPEVTAPRVRVDCPALTKGVVESLCKQLTKLAQERLGETSLLDLYTTLRDELLPSHKGSFAAEEALADGVLSAMSDALVIAATSVDSVAVVRLDFAGDFSELLAKLREWATRDGLDGAIFYRVSAVACRAEDIFVFALAADATAVAAFLGNLVAHCSGWKVGSQALSILFNGATTALRVKGKLPWSTEAEASAMPDFDYTATPDLATAALSRLGINEELHTFTIMRPRWASEETCLHSHVSGFEQFGLPLPRRGEVLGVLGKNGTGKSTCLNILAGKLTPNFGKRTEQQNWQKDKRLSKYRVFFDDVEQCGLRPIQKPQYIESIPSEVHGKVRDLLEAKDERNALDAVVEELSLGHLMDRDITQLSGGELQRFAIAHMAVQEGKLYFVDEPSSYLDIKQRLVVADLLTRLSQEGAYVVLVEHDMAVLDYVSDHVTLTYGKPGHWGMCSFMSLPPKFGVNTFLQGSIPHVVAFREVPISFLPQARRGGESALTTAYPSLVKKRNGFELHVAAGDFSEGEIIVLLGQNGSGKTTLVKMLAGQLKPDGDVSLDLSKLKVSLKPQEIKVKFQGTVQEVLYTKIADAMRDLQFQFEVLRPMSLDHLFGKEVRSLSGGELQRLAVVLHLACPADIYLIDEPSAYLDVEQRIATAQVIKRFIIRSQKTAFVVEHNFAMATYLADRVIVYGGEPGVCCHASTPEPVAKGMNRFLRQLQVTLRRDEETFRPRINKLGSAKDREQKQAGEYFLLHD